MPSIEFIGFTLEFIGKIMIAYTAVSVHYRVWKEHAVDERVFSEMKRERLLGLLGIILMVIGYLLEAPFKF
ncbi:MAG: hypothetical protein O2794_00140 [bacterium]|nr:hypothetical protein [bacterium]